MRIIKEKIVLSEGTHYIKFCQFLKILNNNNNNNDNNNKIFIFAQTETYGLSYK